MFVFSLSLFHLLFDHFLIPVCHFFVHNILEHQHILFTDFTTVKFQKFILFWKKWKEISKTYYNIDLSNNKHEKLVHIGSIFFKRKISKLNKLKLYKIRDFRNKGVNFIFFLCLFEWKICIFSNVIYDFGGRVFFFLVIGAIGPRALVIMDLNYFVL